MEKQDKIKLFRRTTQHFGDESLRPVKDTQGELLLKQDREKQKDGGGRKKI